MAKSMFNPSEWSGAIGKLTGDVSDADPIDQTDLRIIASLSFISGMATQGYRSNQRNIAAIASGEEAKPFKFLLV